MFPLLSLRPWLVFAPIRFCWWIFEIAAAGLVVAAAIFFADDVVLVVDVWDKAVLPTAVWAGKAGGFAAVFQ